MKEEIKHKLHYPVVGGAGECVYCGKQNPEKDEICESAMLARDEAEADALAGQAEYEAQQQAEADYQAQQEAEAQAEYEAGQEIPQEEPPY